MTTMTNSYTARGSAPDDCVRLERDLAAFLDGTLDEARSSWAAEHIGACDRCAALLDGLDAPGDLGRAVAALPALSAPEHLWQGVADRIAAPVVAIGTPRREVPVAGPVAGRGQGGRWFRTAAAAAVLVAATAGVTYELTVRNAADAGRAQVAATPAAGPASEATRGTTTQLPTQLASATPDSVTAATIAATTGGTTDATRAAAARGATSSITSVADRSPRLAAARRAAALPNDPARDTYDREIAKLRGVLAERRGALDTSTVRVLEQSMTVIDRAIARSKAALARDPASGFLNQQLNNALDRKLELLRTAALLPAST